MRAIRRGVKTNQAVLSPSSSLLTSSTSVSEMSYTGGTSGGSSLMSSSGGSPNSGLPGTASSAKSKMDNSKKLEKSTLSSTGTNRHRERRSSTKMAKKSVVTSSDSSSSLSAPKSLGGIKTTTLEKNTEKKLEKQSNNSMALSRHRSSGCLQSRHCHSTLSLSRARSSSALNRVQSRSMNLLMIQNNSVNNNKHGMKNTSSDVLSMASSSSSSGSSSAHEMVDDEEEDEGVATDATADNGNSNNKINTAKKDIKSAAKSRSAPHRNIRINQEDGLAKGKKKQYFFSFFRS